MGFVGCCTEAWGESQIPTSQPSTATQAKIKTDQLGEPSYGCAFMHKAVCVLGGSSRRPQPRGDSSRASGPGSFPAAPGDAPLASALFPPPPRGRARLGRGGWSRSPQRSAAAARHSPVGALDGGVGAHPERPAEHGGRPAPLRPRQPPWRRPAAQRRPGGNRLPARHGTARLRGSLEQKCSHQTSPKLEPVRARDPAARGCCFNPCTPRRRRR